MKIPQLRLLVEGDGDRAAAPVLIKKILKDQGASQQLVIQDEAVKVEGVHKLLRTDGSRLEWQRFLQIATKKADVVACLAILDGDDHYFMHDRSPFCACRAAQLLAKSAAEVGAGTRFSLGIVIASQEFESWIISGLMSLKGTTIDGRILIPSDYQPPSDVEKAPRDAKGWLNEKLRGYSQSRDQDVLTKAIPVEAFRQANMRSFRRLENAVHQLVTATTTGKPILSPPSGK